MSDWQIQIACRDPGDLILDAIPASREGLDETDAQIAEVIVRDALLERSITTVAELLAELGGLDQAGVRARLDWARGELGLPTTSEVDKSQADFHFEAAVSRLEPPPPEPWNEMQVCPYCNAYPIDEHGRWIATDLERWHCPKHRDRAGPDDMQPHQPAYTGLFTRGGRPIPTEKEKARIKAWHEEHQAREDRERQEREEHERRQGEALDAVRERFEREEQVSVLGIRVHPRDVRVGP